LQYILTTTKTIYEECNGVKAIRHRKGTKVFMGEKYFNELKEKGTVEIIVGRGEYMSIQNYKLSDFESKGSIKVTNTYEIKL
jgi:hypothetical protein